VARYGPPDDFNNQPTQHGDYGVPPRGAPRPPPPTLPPAPPTPPEPFEPPESLDPFDEEAEPTPWFRRPVLLGGWALLVVILIGLIIYGIIELIHGDQGTGNIPSSTSAIPSTTTTTTTTTTTPTTATTTTPATGPTTSSAVEQPPQQPTRQPPTHRHHLPPLPSVITIPEVPTVITLPPGLP
jgi:hypothetical protein